MRGRVYHPSDVLRLATLPGTLTAETVGPMLGCSASHARKLLREMWENGDLQRRRLRAGGRGQPAWQYFVATRGDA